MPAHRRPMFRTACWSTSTSLAHTRDVANMNPDDLSSGFWFLGALGLGLVECRQTD